MRPREGRPVADRGGLGSGPGLRVSNLGSRGHSQDTILPGLQPGPLSQDAPNSVPPAPSPPPIRWEGKFPCAHKPAPQLSAGLPSEEAGRGQGPGEGGNPQA